MYLFFVYSNVGSAPYPVLRTGYSPDSDVSYQADASDNEVAVLATSAHKSVIESYEIGDDQEGVGTDTPFTYVPASDTLYVGTPTMSQVWQEMNAKATVTRLIADAMDKLGPDSKLTTASRNALLDYIEELRDLENDPNWPDWDAMTIPSEPSLSTQSTRLTTTEIINSEPESEAISFNKLPQVDTSNMS